MQREVLRSQILDRLAKLKVYFEQAAEVDSHDLGTAARSLRELAYRQKDVDDFEYPDQFEIGYYGDSVNQALLDAVGFDAEYVAQREQAEIEATKSDRTR